MLLLQAMAKREGFGRPGARPTRNNSPLDLIIGDEAKRFGAIGADGRYAKFASVTAGYKAGARWLSIPAIFVRKEVDGYYFDATTGTTLVGGYLGATMAQVIFRFCPKGDGANDPQAYLEGVIKDTTMPRVLTADTILTADLLAVPSE